MVNKIMNAVMNGKVLRFKLINGVRCWVDSPSDEWQKRYEHDQTNLQTNLFTKP
tara:strand:- start:1335 stop:1496 length:162 start_codon:yes stop_codon:yes gene_type:complete